MREERQETDLETIWNAGAIQVVESPRVSALSWEPCTDELGAAALAVVLELERAERRGRAELDASELAGARSIWEALVLRLYESGDERFPYVRFRNRWADEEGAHG